MVYIATHDDKITALGSHLLSNREGLALSYSSNLVSIEEILATCRYKSLKVSIIEFV